MKKLSILALLLLSACKTTAEAPVVQRNLEFRDLTEAEKKIVSKVVADVMKDPSSAQFRWTKMGRDPAQRQQMENVDYCAMVNAKNSYGGYNGFKPYKVTLGLENGKVVDALRVELLGGSSIYNDQIEPGLVKENCQAIGLNPYDAK